jgi:ParB-like nuclease domain
MEPSNVRNAIDAAQTSEIGIHGISITASRMKTLRPETVVSLANSLRTQGLLHPIVLRRAPIGYYLVAGLHRLEAARKLHWEQYAPKLSISMMTSTLRKPPSLKRLPRSFARGPAVSRGWSVWLVGISPKVRRSANGRQIDRGIWNAARAIGLCKARVHPRRRSSARRRGTSRLLRGIRGKWNF